MAESPQRAGGLVVRVGDQRWVIPVALVVEVLRTARVMRLPGVDPWVRGVVNHRGRILTVADAGRALGLMAEAGDGGDLVVVDAGGHRFAVAVDAVVELSAEARTGLAELDLSRIASATFG